MLYSDKTSHPYNYDSAIVEIRRTDPDLQNPIADESGPGFERLMRNHQNSKTNSEEEDVIERKGLIFQRQEEGSK